MTEPESATDDGGESLVDRLVEEIDRYERLVAEHGQNPSLQGFVGLTDETIVRLLSRTLELAQEVADLRQQVDELMKG